MHSTEQIMKSINQNIGCKRDDTFFNHLKSIFYFDIGKFSGNVKDENFKVWSFDYYTAGVFYTVIQGSVTLEVDRYNVLLKTKMNIVGKCFCIIALGFLAYGVITGIIIQQDNSWTFLWKRTVAALVLVSLPALAIRLIYRFERNIDIEKLKGILQDYNITYKII